jgi:hypothetical protein
MIIYVQMPIREEKFRLIDDSRSFTAEQLSAVWEWLDSYDMQPLRSRDDARLERPLKFTQAQYTFQGTIYSVARCDDGREVIGSPIGVVPLPVESGKRNVFARLVNA